ncbi:CRISPR associated protein of unknown function [Salmonella enterica subsp. enterica serovar Cubana]|nr:CRISPR associated protein of unknown function [Salmonella enterica subsp. enterica serovar Cubana]
MRFIPAGAGNTSPQRKQSCSAAVYPRWRGEHDRAGYRSGLFFGLSPLARGTLEDIESAQSSQRFIPAGAGNNTSVTPLCTDHTAVYPRWRGEHVNASAINKKMTGLSPLARGTLPVTFRYIILRRFIPAGAGNTL